MMLYSLSRIVRQVRRRKELGITLLLALIVVAIGGNTLSFYLFESGANPEISPSGTVSGTASYPSRR